MSINFEKIAKDVAIKQIQKRKKANQMKKVFYTGMSIFAVLGIFSLLCIFISLFS